MSDAEISRRVDMLTGAPFILIDECPSVEKVRLMTILPSSSRAISCAERAKSAASLSSPKTALTLARDSPRLINVLSALAPSIKFIESMIIDLPAPVSPVKAVKPCEKSMDTFLITAMFSICKDKSIFYSCQMVLRSRMSFSPKVSAIFSFRVTTSTVSSPAIEPRSPDIPRPSTYAPTALAIPGMVLITTKLTA